MLQTLIDWAPALTLLIGLGGLQLALYNGLRADLRDLTNQMTSIRERLARVETHLGLPAANTSAD